VGRCASAQRQPRCQPRPRLSTRRLSAASALRHEVREEPVGAGGEVGLVVCKPGGGAAGETGDEAACIAAPASAGASRRQPAGPAAAGEAGCSPAVVCRVGVGRLGRRRRQAARAVRQPAGPAGAAQHVSGVRGAPRPAICHPMRQARGGPATWAGQCQVPAVRGRSQGCPRGPVPHAAAATRRRRRTPQPRRAQGDRSGSRRRRCTRSAT